MALNDNPWAPGLDRRMDLLIDSGMAEPAILVFPDCFTALGGSQYLNSPAIGRYEDYLLLELIPWVDERFRTLGAKGRAAFGKSSGGYASLRLSMQNPGLFAAMACHSGDMAFELCYLPDFPAVALELTKCGGIASFLEDFQRGEKKSAKQIEVLNILAMAAAYSPGTGEGKAPDLQLPFDLHDLRLDQEIWQRWLAHDPMVLIEDENCQAALRSLKLLFMDCGAQDEFRLQFGARRFVKRLGELEIPHSYEEFDDNHRSISYRYDRSLPLLCRALTGA